MTDNIYALEYLNEDGEVVVAMFGKNGFIESFISQLTMGAFDEPKIGEAFIVLKTEDYESPVDNATGHWWSPLAKITFNDDAYAYEALEDIDEEMWLALYQKAESMLKEDE